MLTNLTKKLKALKAFDFKAESRKVINKNKSAITDLQVRQLDAGIGSDGKPITLERGHGYAAFTIAQKIKKGQPTDRITWKDTGELHSLFFTEISGNTFANKANSFKFNVMIQRSGPDAVGLDQASLREFIEKYTRPGVIEAYKKKVVNS